MVEKRVCIIPIFLFLICLSFANISAISCDVVARSSCTSPNKIVMGLSGQTNAHGEIASAGNYQFVLCCDGGGSLTCNGANKIIGLSSSTNAHAEVPTGTIYQNNDICYGNLECVSASNVCPPTNPSGLLSLSSSTNAHIGNFSAYGTKICCYGGPVASTSEIYWADLNSQRITSQIKIKPDQTKVYMIFNKGNLTSGTINFVIYEDDTITSDDLITTIEGYVDSKGNAKSEWTISDENIESAKPEYFGRYDFYFIIAGNNSDSLSVTIDDTPSTTSLCSDYTTQSECNVDPNGVADTDVQGKNPGLTCGYGAKIIGSDGCYKWSECACYWNLNSCDGKRIDKKDDCLPGDFPLDIGSCLYSENTNDDCSDGFLDFGWTADYVWDILNTNTTSPADPAPPWIFDSGGWHYDPDDKKASCQGGTNSIACPSQIKLPFFTLMNLFIVALVIGLIYYFINKKSSKKKSKKKS